MIPGPDPRSRPHRFLDLRLRYQLYRKNRLRQLLFDLQIQLSLRCLMLNPMLETLPEQKRKKRKHDSHLLGMSNSLRDLLFVAA